MVLLKKSEMEALPIMMSLISSDPYIKFAYEKKLAGKYIFFSIPITKEIKQNDIPTSKHVVSKSNCN